MIGGSSIPVIVGDDGRSIKTQLPTQDDLIQESLMEDIQACDVAGGEKSEEIRQIAKFDEVEDFYTKKAARRYTENEIKDIMKK
jgi:hypothetical protein